MGWKEFIVALVDALAWPLAVVCLWLTIRKQALLLLDKTKTAKYGDFELLFSENDEIGAEPVAGELRERVKILAETAPQIAIVEAWNQLILECIDFLQSSGKMNADEPKSSIAIGRKLAETEIFDSGFLNTFHDLRHLRNVAVHDPAGSVTPEQADRFIANSDRLREQVSSKAGG